jgi:uncharacterized protein YehS (DUF1456 family)
LNINDYLIRLRYALDLKDSEMQEIFKLGGVTVTSAELKEILTKQEEEEKVDARLSKRDLERFLNGLIIFKRGDNGTKPTFIITTNGSVNNVFLKKLKIALALKSTDIVKIFKQADFKVSEQEITALLRKEGQKNYKEAGNQFIRNFLVGLTETYRK